MKLGFKCSRLTIFAGSNGVEVYGLAGGGSNTRLSMIAIVSLLALASPTELGTGIQCQCSWESSDTNNVTMNPDIDFYITTLFVNETVALKLCASWENCKAVERVGNATMTTTEFKNTLLTTRFYKEPPVNVQMYCKPLSAHDTSYALASCWKI